MYNDGALPVEVAQALYDFLVAPSKPPCESNNDVDGASWKWNNPISFTLGSAIRQATQTVQYMCQDPYKLNQSDHSIPLDLLHAAKGLCFMTVVKAGLVVSGRIGTGVLVARMDDDNGINDPTNIRWSAPCAVGTVGMGWGALMGADVTHYLVVLTTKQAVQDFFSATSLQLGAEMGLAVGPIGRGANSHLATGDWTLHPGKKNRLETSRLTLSPLDANLQRVTKHRSLCLCTLSGTFRWNELGGQLSVCKVSTVKTSLRASRAFFLCPL
jgi:lipid-binding SYLF domain-containing protein